MSSDYNAYIYSTCEQEEDMCCVYQCELCNPDIFTTSTYSTFH